MKSIFRILFAASLILFLSQSLHAQKQHIRWGIKTTVPDNEEEVTVGLNQILSLANPPGVQDDDKRYNDTRIPPFNNPLNLNEGDIVTTEGWLHLVALSSDDQDYHIQISSSQDDGNNCLIVEIPSSTENIADPALGPKFEGLRKYLRDNLNNGQEFPGSGKLITQAVYVQVTGQLFFDDFHLTNNNRGKRGMKSATVWEIHPITDIQITDNPASKIVQPFVFNATDMASAPISKLKNENMNTTPSTSSPQQLLYLIILAAILGMVGQGLRVVVGIKKVGDQASSQGTAQNDLIKTQQLVLSLFIAFAVGAIAGVLAAVGNVNNPFSTSMVFTFIAAGYAGTDFIEGFIRSNPNVTGGSSANGNTGGGSGTGNTGTGNAPGK